MHQRKPRWRAREPVYRLSPWFPWLQASTGSSSTISLDEAVFGGSGGADQVGWKQGVEGSACHVHFHRPTEHLHGATDTSLPPVHSPAGHCYSSSSLLPFSDFQEALPQGGPLRGSAGLVVHIGRIKLALSKSPEQGDTS